MEAFKLLRQAATDPMNPEWVYVPGAVVCLPHPADRYNSAELEDNLSLSFADKDSSIRILMEFDYPRKKADEGLLNGLVPAVLQHLSSAKILRSGARWL